MSYAGGNCMEKEVVRDSPTLPREGCKCGVVSLMFTHKARGAHHPPVNTHSARDINRWRTAPVQVFVAISPLILDERRDVAA